MNKLALVVVVVLAACGPGEHARPVVEAGTSEYLEGEGIVRVPIPQDSTVCYRAYVYGGYSLSCVRNPEAFR